MQNNSIDDWLTTCEAAARAGGQELLAWQASFKLGRKASAISLPTPTWHPRKRSAALLRLDIPIMLSWAKSKGAVEVARNADQLTWIVDPLDGTTNYVHGYPNFAVSVAIARGNDVQAGVIYDPLRDQCFAAAAGKGRLVQRSRD